MYNYYNEKILTEIWYDSFLVLRIFLNYLQNVEYYTDIFYIPGSVLYYHLFTYVKR